MDKEWIKDVRSTSVKKRPAVQNLKVYLTVAIILVGIVASVIVSMNTIEATNGHSDGILIDFEEYNVTWFPYDTNACNDPTELLIKACNANGYTYTFTDGKLTEVKGIHDTSEKTWNLWVWYLDDKQTIKLKISESYDINVKNYLATAWAYRSADSEPTVAVDSTGTCFYGYPQAERIITLSPVSTETVGAMNATSCIVGTDYYSNYPNSIDSMKKSGRIVTVGTYTDPSFELIMKQNPDIIISDGTQYNQVQTAKAARDAGTNAVVLYEGEDIRTIYDNTYIVGIAIGYDMTAKKVITDDTDGMLKVSGKAATHMGEKKKIMVALSPDASPYVAGDRTYVSDILSTINAENAFGSLSGWVYANTETVTTNNPDIIIIVTESYQATQEEWDIMYNNLPDTWKKTAAYENKEIYLLCSKAVDLASRSSPRFPQLAELLGEIIYPNAFGVTPLPKYIGDEYTNYLTITKYLGYDN